MKHFLLTLSLFASAATCGAQSIVFNEKFNDGTYDKNFVKVRCLDEAAPSTFMKSLGFDYGVPWVTLKDEVSSKDICFGSHSQFTMPGIQANDRLFTRWISIPTKGFNLNLDAQSWVSGNDQSKLSDLKIYVTEDGYGDDVLDGKEPDFVLNQVPTGASEKLEGEFTNYTFSLDKWAGKEIVLVFVNQNTDKEIIAIDNVLIARDDLASVELKDQKRYSTDATFAPTVTITGLKSETLNNFKLTLSCDGKEQQVKEISNAGITLGKTMDVTFDPINIDLYATINYTLTLTADNVENPITYSDAVTRIAYYPERKVVVEEGTGTWCGNCPLGAYAMSHMSEDPEMSKYVIGIAVHNGDVMTLSEYDNALGVAAFPNFVINRAQTIQPMTTSSEGYGFGEGSGVYAAQLAHEEPTYVEVDLTGGFNADSTQISCTAAVKNAYHISDAKYKLAFVIIENNVTGPVATYGQTNYFANSPLPLGGWEKLNSKAKVYFHEVARAIDTFNGIDGSVPAAMEAGKEYTFDRTLDVPDNVQNKKYLELVVMVIDSETGEIMNADKLPLTDEAEDKQPLPTEDDPGSGGGGTGSYEDDHTDCRAPHVHIFPAAIGYVQTMSPSGQYIGVNRKSGEGLATFYDMKAHKYTDFSNGSTALSEIYAITDEGLVAGNWDNIPVIWNSVTNESWELPTNATFEWAAARGISADGKTVIGCGYGASSGGYSGDALLWKWDESNNSYRAAEIYAPKPADNKAFQYVMVDAMSTDGKLAYGHASTNYGANVPIMWKADDLEGSTGTYVSPEVFVKTTSTGKTTFNDINSDYGFMSCDGKKISFVMHDDYQVSTPCVYDTETGKTIGYYNEENPLSTYLKQEDAVKVEGALGEQLGHMLPDGSMITMTGGATLYRETYLIGTDGVSVDIDTYLKYNYNGLSIKGTGRLETTGTTMAFSADGKVFAGFAYDTEQKNIASFYVNTSREDLGTVGIIEVETDDESGKTEYYDLQGRRVLTPGNGIYIVKTGNKVVKRLINNK